MRILICTNAYPPSFVGGAEVVAHALAREWIEQGYEVAVFAGDPSSAGERHSFTKDVFEGVVVNRVATTPRDYGIDFGETLKPAVEASFGEVLATFQPDVVHCHNLAGLSPRIPILAAESGSSVFLTLHDYWGFCFRNTLLRNGNMPCEDLTGCATCLFPNGDAAAIGLALRMRRDLTDIAFDHVQHFIAPSTHLKSRYVAAGLTSDRITVVLNGIESARFSPRTVARSGDNFRLLFVGYLGTHKGVDVAIRALALTHSAAVLDIVGEGSEIDRLQALARTLGVSDRVRFRGKVRPAAMAAVYHAADAVVLPSVWEENQPVCLMEAMACGLPVIASRIGGIPSMIEDGREGILFAPGDHRALSAAIEALAQTPRLAAGMGEQARLRVAQQTYERQAAQLMELFVGQGKTGAKSDRHAQLRRSITALTGLDPLTANRRTLERLGSNQDYLVRAEWLTPTLAERVGAVVGADRTQLVGRLNQAFRRLISGADRHPRSAGRGSIVD